MLAINPKEVYGHSPGRLRSSQWGQPCVCDRRGSWSFPEESFSMPEPSKWRSLPTEQINPDTLRIDKLDAAEIVSQMLSEDRKMIAAVEREKNRIASGIDLMTQAIRNGGRIIFVGAGTSGRLGVLEAAEIPPTFGTDPDFVQAIMAGGKGAVFRAREGAEDNYQKGSRSLA